MSTIEIVKSGIRDRMVAAVEASSKFDRREKNDADRLVRAYMGAGRWTNMVTRAGKSLAGKHDIENVYAKLKELGREVAKDSLQYLFEKVGSLNMTVFDKVLGSLGFFFDNYAADPAFRIRPEDTALGADAYGVKNTSCVFWWDRDQGKWFVRVDIMIVESWTVGVRDYPFEKTPDFIQNKFAGAIEYQVPVFPTL